MRRSEARQPKERNGRAKDAKEEKEKKEGDEEELEREGEGEVYALAFHVIPDGDGGWLEDFMCVRYLDRYRRGSDGRWRFAKRVVTYDMRTRRPYTLPDPAAAEAADPSYAELANRLFARGPRQ